MNSKAKHFDGEFYYFACISTKTNLVKSILIDTKSSIAIGKEFEQMCLAQCPRPIHVVNNSQAQEIIFYSSPLNTEYQRCNCNY